MTASAAVFSPAGVGRRGTLADILPGERVRDVLLVIAGAGLTGLAAQLSIRLPHTPVPVTGQTFAVLLAGAALGPVRGFLSMALYLVAGGLGLPWFAAGASGFGGPVFGYIVGFVLAGVVVGALAQRGGDRTPLRTIGTMLLGTLLIYSVGVPWLALSFNPHLGPQTAYDLGMKDFLIGDGLKVLLAAGLLPGAWLLTRRRS